MELNCDIVLGLVGLVVIAGAMGWALAQPRPGQYGAEVMGYAPSQQYEPPSSSAFEKPEEA
jgi:hypothetical protein